MMRLAQAHKIKSAEKTALLGSVIEAVAMPHTLNAIGTTLGIQAK